MGKRTSRINKVSNPTTSLNSNYFVTWLVETKLQLAISDQYADQSPTAADVWKIQNGHIRTKLEEIESMLRQAGLHP